MYINEFAEKFYVTKREVQYWIDLGLIHPKKNENNNYQMFDDENEMEIKRVIIMKAAGFELDLAHLGFFKMIPEDMWEDMVIDKIMDARFRASRFYDEALRFARE